MKLNGCEGLQSSAPEKRNQLISNNFSVEEFRMKAMICNSLLIIKTWRESTNHEELFERSELYEF